MATPTCYTKSIPTDFPNGKVNTSDLLQEINASSIVVGILRIDTEDDVCDIWFKDVLSANEITILDTIVSVHQSKENTTEKIEVMIVEETTKTGGYFCTKSINIQAGIGSSATQDISWPYPISAMAMNLTTTSIVSNDTIDMSVGPNTVIGTLTANSGNNPPQWSNNNYVVGNKVLYTVPVFGERVFTCILNTTAGQNPTNKTFWRFGYELSVSATVIQNTQVGFYIDLYNGSTTNDLGRVLHKTTNSIFMENYPTTSFLAATPTYVRQTVYVLKDHYIGNGEVFAIGEGKIGGSYVPADTIVRVKYTNNGSSIKRLLGFVEYLY